MTIDEIREILKDELLKPYDAFVFLTDSEGRRAHRIPRGELEDEMPLLSNYVYTGRGASGMHMFEFKSEE